MANLRETRAGKKGSILDLAVGSFARLRVIFFYHESGQYLSSDCSWPIAACREGQQTAWPGADL